MPRARQKQVFIHRPSRPDQKNIPPQDWVEPKALLERCSLKCDRKCQGDKSISLQLSFVSCFNLTSWVSTSFKGASLLLNSIIQVSDRKLVFNGFQTLIKWPIFVLDKLNSRLESVIGIDSLPIRTSTFRTESLISTAPESVSYWQFIAKLPSRDRCSPKSHPGTMFCAGR